MPVYIYYCALCFSWSANCFSHFRNVAEDGKEGAKSRLILAPEKVCYSEHSRLMFDLFPFKLGLKKCAKGLPQILIKNWC